MASLNTYRLVLPAFRLAQRFVPVLVVGKTVLVTRHEDCTEVFERERVHDRRTE